MLLTYGLVVDKIYLGHVYVKAIELISQTSLKTMGTILGLRRLLPPSQYFDNDSKQVQKEMTPGFFMGFTLLPGLACMRTFPLFLSSVRDIWYLSS